MTTPWVAFKCWDDCTPSGCPGHTVECKRQNSVTLLHFVYEDGSEKLIMEQEFRAMMEAYLGKYGHPSTVVCRPEGK